MPAVAGMTVWCLRACRFITLFAACTDPGLRRDDGVEDLDLGAAGLAWIPA